MPWEFEMTRRPRPDGFPFKFIYELKNTQNDEADPPVRRFEIHSGQGGGVWFDSYGHSSNTVYGTLTADSAEQLGLALIEAANLTRQAQANQRK